MWGIRLPVFIAAAVLSGYVSLLPADPCSLCLSCWGLRRRWSWQARDCWGGLSLLSRGGRGEGYGGGLYGGRLSTCAAVCSGRRELTGAPTCLWAQISCGSCLSARPCIQGPQTAQPRPWVGLSPGPARALWGGACGPGGGRLPWIVFPSL